MLCRILVIPPMPPKNAKKVGEIDAPNCSRLPWIRKFPPVRALRTAKGYCRELSVMPTLGVSFQVEANRMGRLMPVSH